MSSLLPDVSITGTKTCALEVVSKGELSFRVFSVENESSLSQETLLRLEKAFKHSLGEGLLHLGVMEVETELPPTVSYFRDIARQFVTSACSLSDVKIDHDPTQVPLPSQEYLQQWVEAAPLLLGGEALDSEFLCKQWQLLTSTLQKELRNVPGSIQEYLGSKNPLWSMVGRLCFHLAENKKDEQRPFAFLATYTSRLKQAKAQHVPLAQALSEYAQDSKTLLTLLLPITKVAEQSVFIKNLLESKQIFHPLRWTPKDAYHFLQEVALYEASGVLVRVPNWWHHHHSKRPQVQVKIGEQKSHFDAKALLDFSVDVCLNGETLSHEEWQALLKSTDSLVPLKGQWVEVNRDQLEQVLSHWKQVQKIAGQDGISFLEGMRLLAGMEKAKRGENISDSSFSTWSSVVAGNWLEKTLETLRKPEQLQEEEIILKNFLKAQLRPYQQVGVRWLWFLQKLGLGGCLADDMGLGKTIQVLALLLMRRQSKTELPDLIIVPASLLGNWQKEMKTFAPSLKSLLLHPSSESFSDFKQIRPEDLSTYDVVITSYGTLLRLPVLTKHSFGLVVLDEAQTIKNPQAKQTQAIKSLQSQVRLALTGTPVENRLSDLWSLFDFLNPGLLGTATQFRQFIKSLSTGIEGTSGSGSGVRSYAPLRTLIRPYLLRRLKTDKRVLSDLPEKTEMLAYCSLGKKQAALYQQAVVDLAEKLATIEPIARRGIVLASLMRLKQICNHPSQWLGYGSYDQSDSGKFIRLKEIGQEIAEKEEKVLVFTQFREMCAPLALLLQTIFGKEGLILHGQTEVKKRQSLVDAFQDPKGPPYFILSLKAGGTGLNLTSASHVIHFDRWWNPAVENQATDRAYRIGQKKHVLVHKFVCQGTLEEKIDALITAKQGMAQEILAEGNELPLTELSNEDLLRLVRLDMTQAQASEFSIEEK